MKVISSILFCLVASTTAFTVSPRGRAATTTAPVSSPSFLSMSSSSPKKDFDVADYLQKFDIGSLSDSIEGASKNIMEGEVGKRGELYFVAQWTAILAIALGGLPVVGGAINVLLGPVLLLVGLITSILSVTDLGKSLSPWPTTTSSTQLVTDGLYSQVRHPIYAGLLAACAGLSIVTGSADRLLFTALLWYILELKTDYEEQDLVRTFPNEYPAYQNQVTSKFFPQSVVNVLPWSK